MSRRRQILTGLAALAAGAALLLPRPAAADPVVDRMLAAYRVWAQDAKAERSSIAIIRDGVIVGTASRGATSPDKPEPLASVSKTVTGLCIARLVETGRLRYSDRLDMLLGEVFARFGPPRDRRFGSITVGQLLTQTSGIGEADIDRNKLSLIDQVRDTARIILSSNPGERHKYENKNYQVLGLIVEIVTGRPYEQACRGLVLAPLGIDGHISRLQPFMSSWAGWNISAKGVARLTRALDPRYGFLRSGPKDWPKFATGDRWYYSIGVQLRHNEDDTWSVLHGGAWTWISRELNYTFMSRYVLWGTRIGFAVTAAPVKMDGGKLEHELWKASQPQPGDQPAPQVARPAPASPAPNAEPPGRTVSLFPLMRGMPAEACRRACEEDRHCSSFMVLPATAERSHDFCHLRGPAAVAGVR